MRLYIDGMLVDTVSVASGSLTGIVEVFAGGYDVVGAGGVTLVFGDLMVDLTALSAADVLARYVAASRFF